MAGDGAEHRHGGQIGHGDDGADDLGGDQIDAAQQQGDGAGLAQHAAVVAQQQGHIVGSAHLSADGQRSGGSQGVDAVGGVGIVGHAAGKAHSQGDAGHDGGVGHVIAQAAEQLLDDDDGDERAHDGHPPGQGGGQVKGQQHAGDGGGEVAHGDLTACQLAIAPLEEHTGGHRNDREDEGVDAKNQDRCDQRGQQGDTHPLHDLLRGVRPGDVGRGGNDEFVAHYFFPPFFIMILARAMEGARGRLAGQTKEQVPQLIHRSALSSFSRSTFPS